MNRDRSTPTVSIIDESGLDPQKRLREALERAKFWNILPTDATTRILIHPELGGFSANSPLATDPQLIEALIVILVKRGYHNVAVCGTSDSTSVWAENRDLFALSDLLGYKFETPLGNMYEIIDLADNLKFDAFPIGDVLYGTGLSSAWCGADVRILFSKNRTDEERWYALCLETLLGILPLDKEGDINPGDIALSLLSAASIDFCIIDAIVSAHGGGRRTSEAISTNTLIASSDDLLTDYVGALKMGLDPYASPLFKRLAQAGQFSPTYTLTGALDVYPGWRNVTPILARSAQWRADSVELDALIRPWLQQLDFDIFPLKNTLDSQLNQLVAPFFADTSNNRSSYWLLVLANFLVGGIGRAAEAYRVLFDKDTLRRKSVPLGIDPHSYPPQVFDELYQELNEIERIALTAPVAVPNLRWRYVNDAVVFIYTREIFIPFQKFVNSVDISRTIQFMNDYIGGVVVSIEHDSKGRSIRQAERNLYLPQPNYLVLYQGKHIDVTKIEVVEYGEDQNSLYWKTIKSENESAVFDDGIARFTSTPKGTCITIAGRQLFNLPLFWRALDLNFVPDVKAALVTDAYRTFFDRTIANFEAPVEGRDIEIGRSPRAAGTRDSEPIMRVLAQITEGAASTIQRLSAGRRALNDGQGEVDEDGFLHITPKATPLDSEGGDRLQSPRMTGEINRFLAGLWQAVLHDRTAVSDL